MSKLVFVFLLFSSSCFADEWTAQDSNREYAYLALHTADWLQTRQISKHPERWEESNLILGKHPSTGKVDAYFAIAGLAHYEVAKLLPTEWRKAFQYLSIGVEAGYVAHNLSFGVRAKF